MTIDEDIARDQHYCCMSLALEEEARKIARKLFAINPNHAIGSLLYLVDELMKKSGVDLTKELGAIAKKYDKQMKR